MVCRPVVFPGLGQQLARVKEPSLANANQPNDACLSQHIIPFTDRLTSASRRFLAVSKRNSSVQKWHVTVLKDSFEDNGS